MKVLEIRGRPARVAHCLRVGERNYPNAITKWSAERLAHPNR
jgi:hypothetical protein